MDASTGEIAGVEAVVLPLSEVREGIALVSVLLRHRAVPDGRRVSGERGAEGDERVGCARVGRNFFMQRRPAGARPVADPTGQAPKG
jgi:hypothetical protein